MEKVYEIYIRTTPERLWAAITDPEIRSKYNFGARVTSDWAAGSHFEMGHPTAGVLLGEGENVEVDPPRRLVQTMTALWSERLRLRLLLGRQRHLDVDPSPLADGAFTASSIVAYPGNPGGVHVVNLQIFHAMGEASNVNFSGTWQYTSITPGGPVRSGNAATIPAIAMNDGSLNIAVEDNLGNLDFSWQDSSGAFHEETVDTSANL